jgi:hypothetical protein
MADPVGSGSWFGSSLFRVAQAEHQAAQLGESAHAADARVTRRDSVWLEQVVHHGVAVVWAKRELPVWTAFGAASIHFVEQCAHDGGHVHRAGQVIRLEK